ncbi:hypothetical protein [Spirillospora sp. CA-294931]|uniref:hypothetical protein n=1 Tax=Spirillospora sp. CA-294931 TaxID=3240042 RepID=UPI003D940C2F
MIESTKLTSWWKALLEQAAGAPPTIRALWFGLAATDTGWDLYVTGCDVFDPDDDLGDWACDPTWWPDNNSVPLPGTTEDPLEHAAKLVYALSPEESWPSPLQGIAVGYDDGDFTLVWTT